MSQEINELSRVVRQQLGEADDGTVAIVTAVAGLLATIAYADRDHSEAERREIRAQLGRIDGLGEGASDAVVQVLERHIVSLSTTFVPRFTRVLREQTEPEMRLQVLDVLLSVAAADGTISHEEIVSLRNLTTALGLSQAHYNQLQGKYREYLHFA
jgi:uncharacterized tellurite resistance protein B-like protein